jgi:phosphoadenosine phosphosulfate reductase
MVAVMDIATLDKQFEGASPQAILRWAADTFGDRLAIVTSFQLTGMVTLHMMREIAPRTPVVTVDTELLFPETYEFIDRVEREFDLNLIRAKPDHAPVCLNGKLLWAQEPDRCCEMRKVQPLDRALKSFDAWITGVRRDQSPTRANAPIIQWDEKHEMAKLSPFATWTSDMIDTYIEVHDVPYNPLHDQGYPSIGCYPCTRPVKQGEDARAGRWTGHAKTECGIHLG